MTIIHSFQIPHLVILTIVLLCINIPTHVSSSSSSQSSLQSSSSTTSPPILTPPSSSSSSIPIPIPIPLQPSSSSNNILSPTPIKRNNIKKKRFIFQGPILTLTLKDPFAETNDLNQNQQENHQEQHYMDQHELENNNDTTNNYHNNNNNNDASSSSSSSSSSRSSSTKRHYFWSTKKYNPTTYTNFLNLNSLAPTLLYSIRSISKPLPNYLPSLQSTSITTGYKYEDVRDRPSYVEGELKFRKRILGGGNGSGNGRGILSGFRGRHDLSIEVDIGPSYEVKDKKGTLVLRVGGDGGRIGENDSRYGCFGLVRFVMTKGKRYLEHARGCYKMSLPFTAVGSISITPSYDFEKHEPFCNIIGKSSSGRTAAVLDLNWDNPSLSFVHALDQRNTISPEISLYDAKILYNWSVALDSGAIKTRVDPCSAIQVTWTDQSANGKWVTDFKLPLVGNPGPLAGDIRVRRQFIF